MNKSIILIGAGGHAKVLLEVLRLCQKDVIGIIDVNLEKGSNHFGLNVIGNDEEIKNFSPGDVSLVNGLGSLPKQTARWKIAEEYNKKGFIFEKVIHPTAIIANDTHLEEGVQIMAGSILQPGISIGAHSIINTHASIDHDCNIGQNVHIAPGVTLSGHVKIGNNSHVGTGANIIQSINLPAHTIIRAGETVYKQI